MQLMRFLGIFLCGKLQGQKTMIFKNNITQKDSDDKDNK